jgi:hypothetical protein
MSSGSSLKREHSTTNWRTENKSGESSIGPLSGQVLRRSLVESRVEARLAGVEARQRDWESKRHGLAREQAEESDQGLRKERPLQEPVQREADVLSDFGLERRRAN